jgi:hypothetical protein
MLDIDNLQKKASNLQNLEGRRTGNTTTRIVLMLQTMEIEKVNAVFLIPDEHTLTWLPKQIFYVCDEMRYKYKRLSKNKIQIEDYGIMEILIYKKNIEKGYDDNTLFFSEERCEKDWFDKEIRWEKSKSSMGYIT